MRKKLFIEGLCTFFLCVGVLLAANPVSVAALLCGLIYLGAPFSGAVYIPAVSLGLRLRSRMGSKMMVAYMGVQFLAAVWAAVLVGFLSVHESAHTREAIDTLADSPFVGLGASATVEFLGTFLLVLVILMVGTSRLTSGNSYFGLAIALTVLGVAGCFAEFNPAINPAVALARLLEGPMITLLGENGNLISAGKEFLVMANQTPRVLAEMSASLLGGVLAAGTFRWLFPEDR